MSLQCIVLYKQLNIPEIRSFRQIVDWKSSSWTWTADTFSHLAAGISWTSNTKKTVL